MDKEKVLV